MVLLLAVIIVAFVFTIGNFSPWGNNNAAVREQPFLTYDLSRAQDQQEIFGRGQISLTSNYPSFFGPPSEVMVQDYALSRVAFLHIADEIGIPKPNKEQLTEHIKGLNDLLPGCVFQEEDIAFFEGIILREHGVNFIGIILCEMSSAI